MCLEAVRNGTWKMTILFTDKWMRLMFRKTRKFFILTELETLCFHDHGNHGIMAYEVGRSDNKAVVLHHDLPWHECCMFRKMARNSLLRKTQPVLKTQFKETDYLYEVV